jgi:hypothetical protein
MEEEEELIRVLKKDLSRFSPADVPGKDAIVIMGPGLRIIKPALEKDGWRQVGGDTTLHHLGLGDYTRIIMEREGVRIGIVDKSAGVAMQETTIVPLALAAGTSAYVTGGIDMSVRRILELESLGEAELANKALDQAVQDKLAEIKEGEDLEIVIDLEEPAPIMAAKKKKKGATKTNKAGIPIKVSIKKSDIKKAALKEFSKPMAGAYIKSAKAVAKSMKALKKNRFVRGKIYIIGPSSTSWAGNPVVVDKGGKFVTTSISILFRSGGDYGGLSPDKEAMKVLKKTGFSKSKDGFQKKIDKNTIITQGKGKKGGEFLTGFRISYKIPMKKMEVILDPIWPKKGKNINPLFDSMTHYALKAVMRDFIEKLKGILS